MNNYFYNKLLGRPASANVRTTFHLLRSDRHYYHYSAVCKRSSSSSSISNVNYDDGNFIASRFPLRELNNRHRLLTAFKANSQQHFCTSSTTISNNKLPDPIEQQCREWTQILRAEWEASNVVEEQHSWHGVKLACTDVRPGLSTTKLFFSTANLTLEQRQLLQIGIGGSVELKKFPQTAAGHQTQLQQQQQSDDSIGPLDNILGTVMKQYPSAISIRIYRRLNIQETQLIQKCFFDIRKIQNPKLLQNQLIFLGKRHSDWHKLPGYSTMLQVFKCQPLSGDTGLDPVDWVGSHGKDLDPSQCQALSAALNMNRPIVAVHGPPGTGKTRILAEYLHILSQQGKKVLVVSSSIAGLYHLMGTFCKKFPSAASSNGTFLFLKSFERNLASKVIGDVAVQSLIEQNSISELQKNIDEKTRKFYDKTKILKSAMEMRPDLSDEDDVMREAEEVSEQMREIIHRKSDEKTKGLLQGTSILFTNTSHSMLNMFTRLGLNNFDVVIIDDAARMSEFDCWVVTLPTAPILRLFGDYSQRGIPINSTIGKELNFNKSLLQRMDEQFGPEVNFHLRRQYRSNAAIQAWPNRAFYGQRAAESDESVRAIRLDDLLEEGKSPPPELIMDPLVLVDLGQLEGECHDGMFKAEERGNSWVNWDEAFLAIAHLYNLFEHIPQLHPSKIAYSTSYDAQRNIFWKILSAISGRHVNKMKRIRMEPSANLHGQQFDVVLRDSVTAPKPDEFTDPYHLKRLSNKMCRARRQFIWFTNSKWLEEGSEQSRQLLRTFHEYGRIIGPNQLLPLERGQFWNMPGEVQNRLRQMQDRMMMTSSKNRENNNFEMLKD